MSANEEVCEDPREEPGFDAMDPHRQVIAMLGALLDAMYAVADQLEDANTTLNEIAGYKTH